MNNQTSFTTSDLLDLDVALINVLLTQANRGKEEAALVIQACEFVIKKLEATDE